MTTRLKELKNNIAYKRINGRVYIAYDLGDTTYFLNVNDLFILIDILNEKNGVL